MPKHTQHRWQRWLPTREALAGNRWLRWLAPWLGHPLLWHWSRRGVALGVAIGVFFGLLVPLAQIPLASAAAVVLRANLPATAASTLITNPVTFGPLYYAAYRLGNWLIGDDSPPVDAASLAPDVGETTIAGRILSLGKPLLLGLSLMATFTGIVTYVVIDLFWRWRIARRWKNRRPRAP